MAGLVRYGHNAYPIERTAPLGGLIKAFGHES